MSASTPRPPTAGAPPLPQTQDPPRSIEAVGQSSSSSAAAAEAPGEPSTDAAGPSTPMTPAPASSPGPLAPITTYTISIEPAVLSSAEPTRTDAAPGCPSWRSLDTVTQFVFFHLRDYRAKEAAGWSGGKLQARIRQLTADGEADKAYPLLCERAMRALGAYGAESRATVLAVCSVVENDFQRGYIRDDLYRWLLPRSAQHFGIGHTNTRVLVLRAASELCSLDDPREYTEYIGVVTKLAQQLPGGLGWGTLVVAPVPDEEVFSRHAWMGAKARDAMGQKRYKLANDMLTRCVAYYDTLGPHWLGTPRKALARSCIGLCVKNMDGLKAAEPHMLMAKRTAQRELGMKHPITLDIMWEYGWLLKELGRHEQALSVLQNLTRLHKEVLGSQHIKVARDQLTTADVLRKVRKYAECEALCQEAFENARKVGGPQEDTTHRAYLTHTLVLMEQGKVWDMHGLEARVAKLGCRTDITAD